MRETWDVEPEFVDLGWEDEVYDADDEGEDYPYTLEQGDGDYDRYLAYDAWDGDDRDYYLGDTVD